MSFSNDSWRDSYDAWKLATPPEYEMTGEEEQEYERRQFEERIDELAAAADDGDPCWHLIDRLIDIINTEPCPNCNVEWADQYHGDCDICRGTRHARKHDGCSEALIIHTHSQALLAAILPILGPDAEDDIAFAF